MSSEKKVLIFPKTEEDVKKVNKLLLKTTNIKKQLNSLHDELDNIKRQYYPVIDEKGLRVPPEKSGVNSIVDEYSHIIELMESLRYQLKNAIKTYRKELDSLLTPNVTVRVVKSTPRGGKKAKSKDKR